ncbi:MAG: type IV secretion system DNA-binding domain-containing protein [Pseudolabrys sp.]|nr:type IV secretion system DNA-binding domain-containing protein [Pseudolabrys sp.]
MKLAKYERRDLKATKRVRSLIATAMIVFCGYVAFWMLPPTAWIADGPWLVTGSWLWESLIVSYGDVLAEQRDIIFGYSQVVATVVTLWRIPIATGIATEFYSRIAGCTAASLAAWFAASIIMVRKASIIDTRRHVEGLELVRGRAAVASAARHMANEGLEGGLNLALVPGVILARLREIRGVLLLGPPGSGKTRIILHFLNEILAAMRRFPGRNIRLLVHDTTGEILRGLPLTDDTFAVLHGHRPGGHAWAVGRDVLTMSDAEAFGALQAPHTPGEHNIWDLGSGTLLAGCAVLCQHDHGTAWGISEFYQTTLLDPVDLRERLLLLYPPAATLIEIDKETGGLSKTTVSFFLSFRAAVLRFLRPLAENWQDVPANRQFSFRAWLDDADPTQPKTVVVQRSGRYPELSAAWIGAVVDTIAAHINDESYENSQTRRIFLCLDELASLGRLRRFPDLLDIGRNKGVGVLAAALHEIEQLQERYGDRQAISILRRFRTKIVCQQNLDGATVRFSEEVIGKRTVEVEKITSTTTKGREGTATSKTTTTEEKEVPIIRAEHLADELGVADMKVKAILVGAGNPAMLEWPVIIWRPRR